MAERRDDAGYSSVAPDPEPRSGSVPTALQERILLLECRLEQQRSQLEHARAEADLARTRLAEAAAREAENARRLADLQMQLAEARAEIASLHRQLERADALRAELEGHLFESSARQDAEELVRLRRELLVERHRAAMFERQAERLRNRVEELRTSRETLLTRVAEWQQLVREDGPEAIDLSRYLSELRREILELEFRNSAAERRELEYRKRLALAGIDPDIDEDPRPRDEDGGVAPVEGVAALSVDAGGAGARNGAAPEGDSAAEGAVPGADEGVEVAAVALPDDGDGAEGAGEVAAEAAYDAVPVSAEGVVPGTGEGVEAAAPAEEDVAGAAAEEDDVAAAVPEEEIVAAALPEELTAAVASASPAEAGEEDVAMAPAAEDAAGTAAEEDDVAAAVADDADGVAALPEDLAAAAAADDPAVDLEREGVVAEAVDAAGPFDPEGDTAEWTVAAAVASASAAEAGEEDVAVTLAAEDAAGAAAEEDDAAAVVADDEDLVATLREEPALGTNGAVAASSHDDVPEESGAGANGEVAASPTHAATAEPAPGTVPPAHEATDGLVAAVRAADALAIRTELRRALRLCAPAEIRAAVRPLTADVRAPVRAAAYEALGLLLAREPEALEPIVRAGLGDPDGRVRRRVVLAAAAARGLPLRSILASVRSDPDPQVRRVVREVLRHSPDVASAVANVVLEAAQTSAGDGATPEIAGRVP